LFAERSKTTIAYKFLKKPRKVFKLQDAKFRYEMLGREDEPAFVTFTSILS